jgi:hypothetical protein
MEHCSGDVKSSLGGLGEKNLVDSKYYKKETYRILHSLDNMSPSQAYWHTRDVVRKLHKIVSQAKEFIKKEDGNNAIVILSAISDVYVSEWLNLDDSDGDLSGFFYSLDDALTEAVMVSNLSDNEAKSLEEKVLDWRFKVCDYVEDGFATTHLALSKGWDNSTLIKLLGEAEEFGRVIFDDGVGSFSADASSVKSLIKVRLLVLEARGLCEEYIKLAKGGKLICELVCMLIKQDRPDEAISLAKSELTSASDALEVAKTLRNKKRISDALSIAQIGLNLSGDKHELGCWTGDAAEVVGNNKLAQQALIKVFCEDVSLKIYKRIVKLTPGNELEKTKNFLLDFLRSYRGSYYSSSDSVIHIFLEEKLFEDMIRAVENGNNYSNKVVMKAANAVIAYKPEWVIQECKKRAMYIIEAGISPSYNEAISWLEIGKKACGFVGKTDEWNSYLGSIRINHKPKRKLMKLLSSAFDCSTI